MNQQLGNYSIIEDEIQEKIELISKRINEDLTKVETPIVFVCVLNGGFMFFSDLLKHINVSTEVDFIKVKSYEGQQVKGTFNITKDVEISLKGKTVVLVDDLADSGKTLTQLIEHLNTFHQPENILTVTLLKRYNSKFIPDHYCIEIKHDMWFYGYGMDLDGKNRNLPNILVV